MSATTISRPRLRRTAAWSKAAKVLRAGHAGIAMATVGVDLAALALPIFILQIYDRVLPNQTGATLLVLALGLGCALVVDVILRVMRGAVSSWTTARLEHVLRMGAIDALLNAPLQVFRDGSTPAFVDSVGSTATLREFEAAKKIEIRVDLIFAGLYLAMIAYLGGPLAFVPATLLVVFGGAALGLGGLLHASFDQRTQADQARHDSLLKILRGIHTVKALALNQMMLRRHEPFQENSALGLQTVMTQSALAQTLTVAFAQINTVALLAFGAIRIIDGSMTLGAVAACTLLASRTIQPIQTAIGLWTGYQSIRLARQELAGILSLPAEKSTTADKRVAIRGRIELSQVTYAHPGALEPLLREVSLVVEPGQIVGIEGGSGSGKTTLLHLILGLIRPQSGKIRIDDHDLAELSPEAFRRQTALLTRDAPVYRGTVIDNMTHFREGECVNEAMYVSFLLGADEPIRRLPAGFDQVIEAGDNIPAGLRQRIAIIRSLATGPKIILFDEADLGLDHDSRQRLLNLIKELSATTAVILVSPHADILALASRRYRLSGGALTPVPGSDKAPFVRVVQ